MTPVTRDGGGAFQGRRAGRMELGPLHRGFTAPTFLWLRLDHRLLKPKKKDSASMMDGKRSRVPGMALAILALLVFVAPGAAQYEKTPPPAAYALENVTVVRADGRVESGVNLVVRQGFISALGPGVEIPPDAQVLEGDSLRIYPGLVDAHGKAELNLPEVENPQDVLPWDPPRDAQGFTPHRMAAYFLEGDGSDGRDARTSGVIAAGIHPTGGMAPGQGLAVLFRKGARTSWETVAQSSIGLLFSFQGARGAYPGSLFAVMAMFRQAFEDAARGGLVESEFRRDPQKLTLPPWDPDLEVLRRAASGEMPVFFLANSAGDIRRVLSLAEEIGFRPIIVGGEEAWKVADDLSARGIPVLVSVDFPTPTEWTPPKEEAEEGGGVETSQSADEELEPAAAREKKRLENAYSNAARLVDAGISVSLTSGGGGTDLRAGVAKTLEYGLSEVEALKAVTTEPASLLGIPSVVTVAAGMAANFIVTDGPLFGEGTGILYTFVEGEMEKGREQRAGGTGEAPSVDVSGEWEVMVSAEGMEIPFDMTLVQEGATFSGTMNTPDAGAAQVRAGTVSGNQLDFTMVMSMGPESMEFQAQATVEGDEMSGSGSGEMGDFTFRATRKPGSEGGIR
ncbi:hypothetical protein ACFL3S_02065 [Gemmatimonadota bacterium]